MTGQIQATRRDFLRQSIMTSSLFALPTVVPSSVLGKDGAVLPSEKITLGVIGIGPRGTYDLRAMLSLADVRCGAPFNASSTASQRKKLLVQSIAAAHQHPGSTVRWRPCGKGILSPNQMP